MNHPSTLRSLRHLLPLALATVGFGFATVGHAQEIDQATSTMEKGQRETTMPVIVQAATQQPTAQAEGVGAAIPLTRDEVRHSLEVWRTAGMLPPSGNLSDTPRIDAARKNFDEMQHEVLERPAPVAARPATASPQASSQTMPQDRSTSQADTEDDTGLSDNMVAQH
jgi:hypothetical protein